MCISGFAAWRRGRTIEHMKITTFFLSTTFVFFGVFAVVPHVVFATGMEADAQCNPVITKCGCGQVPSKNGCTGGPNKFMCPCTDTTNGFTTTGICIAQNRCKGQQTQGLDGKGMEAAMKGLMDALQKLMQGQQQQGSGSGENATSQPPPTCSIVATMNTTTTTSTSTTATSTDVATSTATTTLATLSWTSANATEATIEPGIGSVGTTGTRIVVPLAGTTYVLSVTGAGGYYSCSATISGGAGVLSTASTIGDTLLNALDSGNQTSIADLLNNAAANSQSDSSANSGINKILGLNSDGAATTSKITLGFPGTGLGVLGTPSQGQKGNILVDSTGAMIIAGVRTSNSETASFYGSGSSASQPTSFVGKVCTSRPWASGLVAAIIPASFFDSLCSWQGYQVGTLAPSGTGTAIIRTAPQAQPVKAQPQGVTVQQKLNPQAKIWAQPAAVRLGSRTSIFWTSADVQSCAVTGPSFTANTLAGGASTVPLSGEATYTIKCTAADGTIVTKSTTVTLAI